MGLIQSPLKAMERLQLPSIGSQRDRACQESSMRCPTNTLTPHHHILQLLLRSVLSLASAGILQSLANQAIQNHLCYIKIKKIIFKSFFSNPTPGIQEHGQVRNQLPT